ncbi:MAG: uracil-DNA glycosylase [Magnetococcales bacterium]|nr:uracil-DNA glycosylase [Magnetococcales bacterium]|tara:strand:+ start:32594 stop:33376 length:783 start_codon:yes stop_codon:yes gene_type:complete
MEKLSLSKYPYKNWNEYFKSNISFLNLKVHKTWRIFFNKFLQDERIIILEEKLNDYIKKNKDKMIYPYPELVFNAFNLTPLNKVKVVILGQDPYHGFNTYQNKKIPEAMGLSFSTPNEVKIPSSLKNVFKNLLKFNHIESIPKHGNLTKWAKQGVLLINTAYTVHCKKANSHSWYWKNFSEQLIKFISDNTENTIFVLWGRPAYSKIKLIDTKKHFTTISSHPSGLSCNKPMGSYKPFMEVDHFGFINSKLDEKIDFNLI